MLFELLNIIYFWVYFIFIPEDRSSDATVITTTENTLLKNDNMECPENNSRIPLFSLPCQTNSDCLIFGSKMVCCSRRCVESIYQKKENISGESWYFTVTEKIQ